MLVSGLAKISFVAIFVTNKVPSLAYKPGRRKGNRWPARWDLHSAFCILVECEPPLAAANDQGLRSSSSASNRPMQPHLSNLPLGLVAEIGAYLHSRSDKRERGR